MDNNLKAIKSSKKKNEVNKLGVKQHNKEEYIRKIVSYVGQKKNKFSTTINIAYIKKKTKPLEKLYDHNRYILIFVRVNRLFSCIYFIYLFKFQFE